MMRKSNRALNKLAMLGWAENLFPGQDPENPLHDFPQHRAQRLYHRAAGLATGYHKLTHPILVVHHTLAPDKPGRDGLRRVLIRFGVLPRAHRRTDDMQPAARLGPLRLATTLASLGLGAGDSSCDRRAGSTVHAEGPAPSRLCRVPLRRAAP